MSRKTVRFCLQPTATFPEGAPQREEYDDDETHELACRVYAREWVTTYRCSGCKSTDCPQCSDWGRSLRPGGA